MSRITRSCRAGIDGFIHVAGHSKLGNVEPSDFVIGAGTIANDPSDEPKRECGSRNDPQHIGRYSNQRRKQLPAASSKQTPHRSINPIVTFP